MIYFNQTEGIDFTYAPLQIVVGESEPKNITIKLDAQTDECFHDDNAQKDQQGHVIKFLSLKNEGMTALVPPTDTQVSWNQFHPKPSLDEIIKGIWLPNIQPIKHQINFTTCRHQKKMDIEIYPALEYTFNAHIGVAEDQYIYVKQTKNYQKRVYKGKKKDGTKTAKKTYNKNRKEAYLGEVDDKVTGTKFHQKQYATT